METVLTAESGVRRLQIITQWFEPEPAFKGLSFAREMVRRGFDVEVITGFPNYPTGKIYPGYKMKLLCREVVDGVKLVRLPLYPSHDGSAVRRMLNYASFSMSVLVYGVFGMRKADVMYVYHPPLTIGLSAILIRALRRIPVVYDIQDLWPDTLAATGMLRNQPALKLVGVICQLVYRFVDEIAVLSAGFRDSLVARGVPDRKVTVIRNWAIETSLRASDAAAPFATDDAESFNVVYAGNLGKAQGLEAVIDAAEILRHSTPTVRVLFVGDGLERVRLQQLVKQKCLDNVLFFDPVPATEIGSWLSSADALLVHLVDDPLFKITIPSKIQAYLFIGRPVVMAVGGEAADLIREAGAGVVAAPGDAESIACAISWLANARPAELAKMSERGRLLYDSMLRMELGVDAFASLCLRAARRERGV